MDKTTMIFGRGNSRKTTFAMEFALKLIEDADLRTDEKNHLHVVSFDTDAATLLGMVQRSTGIMGREEMERYFDARGYGVTLSGFNVFGLDSIDIINLLESMLKPGRNIFVIDGVETRSNYETIRDRLKTVNGEVFFVFNAHRPFIQPPPGISFECMSDMRLSSVLLEANEIYVTGVKHGVCYLSRYAGKPGEVNTIYTHDGYDMKPVTGEEALGAFTWIEQDLRIFSY